MTSPPAPRLSVVIPIYNEEGSLRELYQRLTAVLRDQGSAYEIICVDDGSNDTTSSLLAALSNSDPCMQHIQFYKNYGKSQALAYGFRCVRGQIIITLDADLQDLPEEIPALLTMLNQGYDIVSAWRYQRCDIWFKRGASHFFNLFVRLVTKVQLHDINCCLKAYRREALAHLNLYGEHHRFIPVFLAWKGFSVGEVKVAHARRHYGRSKFGMYRYLAGFLDLLTVFFLSRYRHKPLHLFGVIGLFFLMGGGSITTLFLLQWVSGIPMHIRPLMVFGWVLLIMGIQFISIGLLCELITASFGKGEDIIIKPVSGGHA